MLPQYSGGLGILAGDHLKTASDLGVPLDRRRPALPARATSASSSPARAGSRRPTRCSTPTACRSRCCARPTARPRRCAIDVPGEPELVARIFVAQVGRVPLLLLDTDVEDNPRPLREVTDRLYGGTTEHRLLQELLLGVGGVRALRALLADHRRPGARGVPHQRGPRRLPRPRADPRAHRRRGRPRASTSTPPSRSPAPARCSPRTPRCPAGIDRFPRELIEQYFGAQQRRRRRTDRPDPGLGAEDYEGGDRGVFNMAVMGFRLSQRANGVSLLHGQVSRGMFNGLWPAFDEAEVPITSITNGVHAPTWVAREVFELASKAGRRHRLRRPPSVWNVVDKIPAADLWSTKRELRKRLVEDARGRLRKSWLKRGAAPAELGWIDTALDPDVLTIGFARRVPSYKRLTLMLRDPERLKRLLLHPERPIQLVIAGKAHPADDGGKKLIQEIVQLADDPEVRHRIVFLPNYDIAMAQPLYPGCDVWLNNPLRPYEACGTSGMKAALNGGLNLSILDGWWDEWYDGDNGWAIPSADGVEDPDQRDDIEANALYDLIENEVAPRFYDLDDDGRADALDRDGAPHAEVARAQGARHPDGARVRRPPLHAGRRRPPAR